jgi:hypothetical protein
VWRTAEFSWGVRRPDSARRQGGTEGDSSSESSHSITTSYSQSQSMARDTGILQDRDSRGELRLDLRVTAEKWWTGGELNSRHRDFQSRAFACRGADFRTWSPKRGPSGFTCWSRHPQSLGLSAPGCGKSRPWKRPAAHAESSLRVYTPKRLGRVSALSRLKHGSRLVGDWLKSDQSGRGPRLSPLCRPAADPRRGDGAPRRAPAPRGARGSPPEPPLGRPAPTV